MNNEYVIEVDDVTVRFNMASENVDNIKEYIIKLMKHELLFQEFIALKDVSLKVKKGEAWGIIGTNGSGKSTLLKLISGILTPYKGSVKTNGTIAPLIELGAGLDMNLTARENIYLDGCLLGHSRKFMEEHFDDIVDFAELWDFLDVPLKNYSSGMQARIGFAIATMVQPEILIVDEILSVGDYRFQQKCMDRMKSMLDNGATLLFVSHSIDDIRRMCDHVLWIDSGKMMMAGKADEVCNAYMAKQTELSQKFESPIETKQKYLMTTYNNNAMKLQVYKSNNGIKFDPIGNIKYEPEQERGTLRDPSFIKYGDYYYITYTAIDWGEGSYFGMCRTKDFGVYEEMQLISVGDFKRIWSPAFCVEDDKIYIVFNATYASEPDDFNSYIAEYLPETNSIEEYKMIEGLPDNIVDSRIYNVDNNYYLFYKNESTKYIEIAKSNNIYGPYTIIREGDWAGWGTHLGGPCLVKLERGKYRLFFEDYTINQLFYADCNGIEAEWSEKKKLYAGDISHPEIKAFSNVDKDVFWDYGRINNNRYE